MLSHYFEHRYTGHCNSVGKWYQYRFCSAQLIPSIKLDNPLFYCTIKINHHNSPFVLISVAFILSHILQCFGQQSWRQVIFIELQAKHQSSLGVVENDEDGDDMIFGTDVVSYII